MPMLFDILNYLTFLDCVSHFDSRVWEMEYFPPYQSTTDVTVIDNCSHDRWWAGSPEGSQEGKNTCHLANIMEKTMAPYSSTLAWKIPWTEEPGRLQSMGSLRVGHDRATSLSLFTFMHWRRKWQPTPVFLPGEFQGWGSLVGCHLWGHTESDMTERLSSSSSSSIPSFDPRWISTFLYFHFLPSSFTPPYAVFAISLF